jgi:hypothetical protein
MLARRRARHKSHGALKRGATTDRVVRARKLESYTLIVTGYLAIGELPRVP